MSAASTTGWPRRARPMVRRRGSAALVALVATGSLAGCIIDPLQPIVTVHNETAIELTISHRGEHLRTVPAGTSGDFALGRGDQCRDWVLEASTPEGDVVATRDAPVCDQDEWTIEDDAASG